MRVKKIIRYFCLYCLPLSSLVLVLLAAVVLQISGLRLSVVASYLVTDKLSMHEFGFQETKHDLLKTHIDKLVHEDKLYPSIQYSIYDLETDHFTEYSTGSEDVLVGGEISGSTTFMMASATKVITGMALSMLSRDLESSFTFANLLSKFIDHNYDETVTIFDLVTHQAGIVEPAPISDDWFHVKTGPFSDDEILSDFLKSTASSSKPKGDFLYSNVGYWILGKVIEKASGMTFEDYVKFHLFEEMGNNMEFDTHPESRGHIWKYNPLLPIIGYVFPEMFFLNDEEIGSYNYRDFDQHFYPLNKVIMNGNSYGGLVTNCHEFVSFLKSFVMENEDLVDDVRFSFLDAVSESVDKQLFGKNYIQKIGGAPGFSANIRIYEDQKMISCYATNTLIMNPTQITKVSDVLDSIFVRVNS